MLVTSEKAPLMRHPTNSHQADDGTAKFEEPSQLKVHCGKFVSHRETFPIIVSSAVVLKIYAFAYASMAASRASAAWARPSAGESCTPLAHYVVHLFPQSEVDLSSNSIFLKIAKIQLEDLLIGVKLLRPSLVINMP